MLLYFLTFHQKKFKTRFAAQLDFPRPQAPKLNVGLDIYILCLEINKKSKWTPRAKFKLHLISGEFLITFDAIGEIQYREQKSGGKSCQSAWG